MYKNKTAKPISVSSYCTECFDGKGHYLGETAVVLTVQGDCVSKVYKDNYIESLNPPFAKGGTFYSVKYEAEKDISIIEYRFRNGWFNNRFRTSEKFREKMQAQINEQKIKDFEARLLKQQNENNKQK